MAKTFIIIILLLGSGIIGLFYLGPAWQSFLKLNAENENLKNISAELDGLIENRDALLKIINTVNKDDLARINYALPQGQKSAEFLVALEAITQKNGVVLKRVDLASGQEQKPVIGGQPRPGGAVTVSASSVIKEFPFTIHISGSYDSFKSFLKDLERSLRIIEIESVSFNAPSKNEAFEIAIRGKTYYQ